MRPLRIGLEYILEVRPVVTETTGTAETVLLGQVCCKIFRGPRDEMKTVWEFKDNRGVSVRFQSRLNNKIGKVYKTAKNQSFLVEEHRPKA